MVLNSPLILCPLSTSELMQFALCFFFRICILMAEQSIALRDSHQAITHYQEALKYSQDDIKVITPLARLYLQVNNVVDCKAMCTRILKLDPNNEAASVMMADISFRGVIIPCHFRFCVLQLKSPIELKQLMPIFNSQMNFESAAFHFSQLLIGQPTYWTALARLIEVLRR